MTDTAFCATYSDFRLVRTRKVIQVVLEVPLEQADAALKVLGGMPKIGEETWVGVAPIVAPKEKPSSDDEKQSGKPRTPWHELKPSKQAVLRCKNEQFQGWLGASSEDQAAVIVRNYCLVESRGDLDTDKDAARVWRQLDERFLVEAGRTTEPR